MKQRLPLLLVVLFALLTAATSLRAQSQLVQKNVLLEEFTGAWCSYCPGVRPFLDSLSEAYPNLIIVAIHAGGADAMKVNDGLAIADTFRPPAYPTAMIDRVLWSQNYGPARASDKWIAHIEEQRARPGQADVAILAAYDAESRSLNATVTAEFVTNVIGGEFRLNLYLVEDSVVGLGRGYDQFNSYNNVAGHPYFGAGNPIVGYRHDHVLRAVLSGPTGTAGVIPFQPQQNIPYSTNYRFTLPPEVNPAHVRLIAFLSYFGDDWSNREVMNATEIPLQQQVADAPRSILFILARESIVFGLR
jgi:thiol-disulfide isomerase/thioredoxin